MKPTSMVILFLMIFLWRDVSSAHGDQVAWRWRNDDGNVYSATWKDSLNTPVVLTQYENIRLRIEFASRHADADRISLRYTEDPDSGAWIPITGVDTGRFFLSPSHHVMDGMSYCDNQLLPPMYPDLAYRRTITLDSSISYVLVADPFSVYEFEYSIKPTNKIRPGSAYFFSCYRDTISRPMRDSEDWEPAVLLTPPVNWRSQSIGRWCSLNDVSFVDANHGISVGGGFGASVGLLGGVERSVGIIFRTVDGGKTWLHQSSPPCEPLNAVDFANADVGIAVGSAGTILRTTDGGQDWFVLGSVGSNTRLLSIGFCDERNGVIVGDIDSVQGLILRTTNGGENWFEQSCPAKRPLFSVHFSSSEFGTAVGDTGTILRTTNGGQYWFSQSSPTTSDLRGVYFTDANNGTVVGGKSSPNGGIILRTTDGGATWRKSANAGAPGLRSVRFADERIGWTVGYGGWILKTTDGGLSWTKLTSGTYRSLYSVRFLDSKTGWVVGERGTVLSTTNGGATPYGGITSVDQKQVDGVPTKFVLLQNYPNPFNPTTKIQFTIDNRQLTIVKVFDVLGRDVATLVNEEKQPGTYTVEYDARLAGGQGSSLSSGIYFYQLVAGEFSETKRMMVLK